MRGPAKRKSVNDSRNYDIASKKQKFSSIDSTLNSTFGTLLDDSIPLPEVLASKLDSFAAELVRKENVRCPDLVDFDIDDVEDPEQIKEMRDQLSKKIKHFDTLGTTDVNYETAAIAGAKILVDERPATRNMTKRLAEEVGCNEGTLLYRGLPSDVLESKAAKFMAEKRKEGILESFIDFQKQLKFKKSVLDHVAEKSQENAIQTRRRQSAQEMRTPQKKRPYRRAITDVQRTPKKQSHPNPLSFTKIMDNYADMIASAVKDRSGVNHKRLQPIPFNLESDSEETMDV